MGWQPILEDSWQDRARESVGAIMEALSGCERDREWGWSLAGGSAGVAILHDYLGQSVGGDDHVALACDLLHHATQSAVDHLTAASLFGGLAGVGWAVAHLQDRLPTPENAEALAEIDNALIEHLDQSPWTESYDLIEGLVGLGVYALERGPIASAMACLTRVIDRLAEMAEYRSDGVTWVSCGEWLPPQYQARYPRRYCNLGVAHGVPGVIALLAQTCAASVAVDVARPLLDGSVRWLLAHQTPAGFPYGVPMERADEPARLAWCYGDAGVAATLLGAARCVGEPDWERAALAIARRAARRPVEQSGVVDAGLCHGAAGLAHLFNRMFQATGDQGLGEAVRYWFKRTLAMRQPGRGIGGYEAWGPGKDAAMEWVADPSLLTGSTGIALALAAANATVEPDWDRVLLVAVPPLAAPKPRSNAQSEEAGTLINTDKR